MSLFHCQVRRALPGMVPARWIGAAVNQTLHDVGPAHGGKLHQRRVAVPVFLVDRGAQVDQQRDHVGMAGVGGQLKRGIAMSIGAMKVTVAGARAQQKHHIVKAMLGREQESGHAGGVVDGVYIASTDADQALDRGGVAMTNRCAKSGARGGGCRVVSEVRCIVRDRWCAADRRHWKAALRQTDAHMRRVAMLSGLLCG